MTATGDLLRVVSWNVRSLRDDAREVARALRRMEPDLVCVQEAPRLLLWRLSRHRLARAAGLRVLTPARACGNLLLAGPRVRPLATGVVRLPHRPGLHRRAAAWAQVEVGSRPLVLACTHLDLDAAARLDSARRVRSGLPRGPLVLGADVNDEPGTPAWAALADGLLDRGGPPTFPASAPGRRLDALLVDPALEVVSYEVEATGPASDHLAVRADLRWR